MWIRSQDKRVLVDTKRVSILQPNRYRKKFEIVNYVAIRPVTDDNCEDYDILGEYETEKRAMLILDGIQELREEVEKLKLRIIDKHCFYEKYNNLTFQMPEK